MTRQGFRVFDSDIHCNEPGDLWLRYLEPAFRDQAPRPTTKDEPGDFVVLGRAVPAHFDRPERQENFAIRQSRARDRFARLGRTDATPGEGGDPTRMLKAMDTEGIDVSAVFRTRAAHVIAMDDMPPPLAAALCRAYNNWLVDFCSADPVRLRVAALMPMHDVNLAVAEARRAVKELGAVALVLPNNPVRARPWYDVAYDPFWSAAQEMEVAVAFHGIQLAYQEHVGNRFLSNFALTHAVAHPIEMMMAVGAMLTGGVLERFPRLRAAFLEGHCSWAPFWLYCLDERWEKFGNEERFGLTMLPSEYFKRQCFISVDPDEELVVDTVRAIGDENIVISSDWPHDDSSYPQAINLFLNVDGLTDETRRKILWDNCARLYGVERGS